MTDSDVQTALADVLAVLGKDETSTPRSSTQPATSHSPSTRKSWPRWAAMTTMRSSAWRLSWRADPVGRVIADRHYNRQSVGADQFVPPGRCLVLLADVALWVTSWPFAQYVAHDWAGAWVNSTFRRESGDMHASDMIREAVAVTRWKWPTVPALGMVTMVNPRHVEHKREPGWIYKKAGFRHVGYTKEEALWVWQLLPEDMPEPIEPQPRTGQLLAVS